MNLDNGSSVVVRINDRGPFAKNRLIDLSEAAARILGIIPTGTAEVSLTLIPKEEALAWRGGGIDGAPAADPPAADTAAAGAGSGAAPTSGAAVSGTGSAALALPRVRIQVASYTSESNARATVERLSLSGLRAIIQSASGRHRVVILDLSLQESRLAERRLDDLGYRGYTITTIRPASNP